MKKLQSYLNDWIKQGFITKEQKNIIYDYEQKKGKKRKLNYILYGFLILGGVVLGVGVISIIAANWEDIPSMLKLAVNFGVLLGIAYAIYNADAKKKPILFDTLTIIFALLCLASIGLISQIYHTGGHPYQALVFWIIIILPLSILSKYNFMPNLWVVGFLSMFLAWAFSNFSIWYFFGDRDDDYFTIFLFFPLMCLTFGNLLSSIRIFERFGKSFNFWAIVSVSVTIFVTDLYYSFSEIDIKFKSFWPVIIFSILALIFMNIRKQIQKKEKIIISVIIVFFLTIYLIPKLIYLDGDFDEFGEVFAPLVTIVSLVLFSIYFSIRDNKKIFNLITLLIGLRFIIVYFQVIGNLALTGFGLIISGLFIIGIALAWYKSHEKIEKWIKGIIK